MTKKNKNNELESEKESDLNIVIKTIKEFETKYNAIVINFAEIIKTQMESNQTQMENNQTFL